MQKNEIVTIESKVSELPSYQTLKEGVYWRALVEIDLGTGWVKGENGCSHREQIIIPEKRVLLLLKLHFVDSEVHSVTLHHHPSDPNKENHKFLVKDFLDQFEPAYDAEIVRAKELAEIQQQITDIQSDLVAGPKDEVIISGLLAEKELDEEAGLPEHAITEDTPMGALITQSSSRALQVETIQRQIRNQQIIIQAKAKWMTSQTEKLTKTVAKMAPFFVEKSAAALATCEETLQQHNKIIKAVANLELYTLKGVEVQQICAGESADPSEKIFVFQRKLFLDEETLIHLGRGGADFHSYAEFAKELDQNEALRNRLIPCQRGVVAIQWRRNSKKYDDNPFVNAHMNAENLIGFLLVRDGDNFYQVYSELVTDKMNRMFPTREEMDSTFKTYRGEDITFRDIDFARARDHHDNVALHYKRTLLLLWGLQDGRQLFGTLSMEEQYGQLNWFSHAVQTQLLNLVYDDERSTLIGELMPPINDWIKDKNRYLQAGSRVIAVHHGVMSADTCPSAVKKENWRGHHSETFKAQPSKDSGIHTIYKKGEQFFIDIPCRSYNSGSDRNFNAACNLSKFDGGKESFYGFLCLDAVDPDHIDYYLESRQDRQYYLRYVKLFFEVQKLLKNEREQEKGFVEECRQALVEGNIIQAETKVLPLIRDVIRNYRAANKGAALPSKGSPLYQGCFQSILNILFVMLGAGRDRVNEVEKMLAAEGRQPLRFIINGQGKMIIYATLLTEEIEARLGSCPWVMALRIEEKKTTIAVTRREYKLLPEFSATELTVKEWDSAEKYAGEKNPYGCCYEDTINLFESLAQAGVSAQKWFSTHNDSTFEKILEDTFDSIEKASVNREVVRTLIRIPLMRLNYQGITTRQYFSETRFPAKQSILYWESDALNMLYSFATPSQQKQLEKSLGDLYHNPKTHIAELKKAKGNFEALGRLYVTEINKNTAKATLGSPTAERLAGLPVWLDMPFNFVTPGDRISLYQKSTFSHPVLAMFGVSDATPLSKESNSVINGAAEYKRKAENEKKYGKLKILISNTLKTAEDRHDDGFGYDDDEI